MFFKVKKDLNSTLCIDFVLSLLSRLLRIIQDFLDWRKVLNDFLQWFKSNDSNLKKMNDQIFKNIFLKKMAQSLFITPNFITSDKVGIYFSHAEVSFFLSKKITWYFAGLFWTFWFQKLTNKKPKKARDKLGVIFL